MKKTICILVLVLLVAAGAAYVIHWKRPVTLGDLKAAEYLPADAVALVEITDYQRSKERWKETALYKIAQEPDVAAFLSRPKSLVPASKQMDRLDRFRKLDPKEIFVASTGQGAAGPNVIGGFDFTGDKKDAEALVADLKSDLKAQYPDGKSDLQQYGSSEIETFTHDQTTIATAFAKDQWFFASNDLSLLKSTLDRLEGATPQGNSLRDAADYKLCLGKLPKDSDAVVFLRTKGIIDTLVLMLEAAPNVDMTALNELKKIQAVAGVTKFDGEKIRDAIFVYRPDKPSPALALNSMPFTSAETVLYYVAALNMKKAPEIPAPEMDTTGMFAVLRAIGQELTQAGLSFDDFKQAFGNECSVVMDWGQSASTPALIFTLDVQDKAKAQKFLDIVANGWEKQEVDGTQYYRFLQAGVGVISISPVLALTDKAMLFGTDAGSVRRAVQGAKSDGARIDKSGDFQAASGLVNKPTGAFAYIDAKGLFERVYEVASKAVIMAPFLYPHIGEYVDLGKLPPAASISKHLSPIVYSQSSDDDGILIESAGPVTFTEMMFGVGAGIGVIASAQMHAHPPRPRTLPTPPPTPAAGQPDSTSTSPQTSPGRQVQTGVQSVYIPFTAAPATQQTAPGTP